FPDLAVLGGDAVAQLVGVQSRASPLHQPRIESLGQKDDALLSRDRTQRAIETAEEIHLTRDPLALQLVFVALTALEILSQLGARRGIAAFAGRGEADGW